MIESILGYLINKYHHKNPKHTKVITGIYILIREKIKLGEGLVLMSDASVTTSLDHYESHLFFKAAKGTAE